MKIKMMNKKKIEKVFFSYPSTYPHVGISFLIHIRTKIVLSLLWLFHNIKQLKKRSDSRVGRDLRFISSYNSRWLCDWLIFTILWASYCWEMKGWIVGKKLLMSFPLFFHPFDMCSRFETLVINKNFEHSQRD
jgi:hypothetical protein